MDLHGLEKKFRETYGAGGDIYRFHSPGRVNLIGEHTDYNGGYVFPCALSFGTFGVIRKRNDGTMKFASTNNSLFVEANIKNMEYDDSHGWANYMKGVAKLMMDMGKNINGFEIYIHGNIPNGSGLSSSASLELMMSVALNKLYDCGMNIIDLVKLSQKVENEYVGVNCGIMDQFSIGMGRKDHAVLLNCMDLSYKYIPLVLDGYKIIIANTNKQRGLTDSKYNERRSQCEKAVEYLNSKMNINLLGELTIDEFNKNKSLITDGVILKRAEHVVCENNRALKSCDMLINGDLKAFGELMNQSHISLKDYYEVTGFELDTMVEEAWKIKGCIGSRMTGAGFGGCTVSIVQTDEVDSFINNVGMNYKEKTGLNPAFYIAEAGDGVKEV